MIFDTNIMLTGGLWLISSFQKVVDDEELEQISQPITAAWKR